MSSDMRDYDKWDRYCPACQGRRIHGMGNLPCEACGGVCRPYPEPEEVVHPRSGPVAWTDEMRKDLEAFHGKKGSG